MDSTASAPAGGEWGGVGSARPKGNADRKAWVEAKVRLVQAIGWRQALQQKLVKDLKDPGGAHEIRIKGKGPAYRLICFPIPGKEGRIVVTTTCSAKSDLLGKRLKKELIRAKTRLDKWVDTHGELLR